MKEFKNIPSEVALFAVAILEAFLTTLDDRVRGEAADLHNSDIFKLIVSGLAPAINPMLFGKLASLSGDKIMALLEDKWDDSCDCPECAFLSTVGNLPEMKEIKEDFQAFLITRGANGTPPANN